MPCHDADSTCASLWHFSGKWLEITVSRQPVTIRISCFAVESLSARRSLYHVSHLVGASVTRSLWNADVDRAGKLVSTLQTCWRNLYPGICWCLLLLHYQLHFLQTMNSQSVREAGEACYVPTLCIVEILYRWCKSTETVYGAVLPKHFCSWTLFGFEK